MRLMGLALAALAAGCASAGDPPGGPPDTDPPRIVQVDPDSGTVLPTPPDEINLMFDEVVGERIAGQRPDLSNAVILSPAVGRVRVSWHRTRIRVRLEDGFRPGRVYRLEVLPVLVDLRQNRLRAKRTIVFSTGPEIARSRISGALVDWPGGRPAPGALIEAVLLPDSLPYRWLADSTGGFDVEQLPPGEYLVYGVLDTDGNRRRGPREAYDTVRVRLDSSVTVELYAFQRDTLPPRLRQIEIVDSQTIRLSFDRPLEPRARLEPSAISIAPETDSTARIEVAGVYTQRQMDSLRARADSARPARDSAARRDTTARDTAMARAAPPRGLPAPPGPAPSLRPGAPPAAARPGAAPARPAAAAAAAAGTRDSTAAQRMLARRRPPSDARFVRLNAPLVAEQRYIVLVESVTSLNGVSGSARGQLRVPRPRPPARAPRDTAQSPRDTTRPAPRP